MNLLLDKRIRSGKMVPERGEGMLWNKIITAVSYITWYGLFFALLVRDRTDRFMTTHLNSAILVNIVALAAGLFGGFLGLVLKIITAVLMVWGVLCVLLGREEIFPGTGKVQIIK